MSELQKMTFLILSEKPVSQMAELMNQRIVEEHVQIHTELDPSTHYEIVFYYAEHLSRKTISLIPKSDGFTICAGKWIDESIFEPDEQRISVAEVESELEAMNLFAAILEFGCTNGTSIIGVDFADTKTLLSNSHSWLFYNLHSEPLSEQHGELSRNETEVLIKRASKKYGTIDSFFCSIAVPFENCTLMPIQDICTTIDKTIVSERNTLAYFMCAAHPEQSLTDEILVSLIAVVNEL